jgi:hypothetical protein
MHYLSLLYENRISTFPLEPDDLIAGRDPTCSIVSQDPKMSQFHFRIIRSNQNYGVQDLGSSNGTTVLGQPLKPLELYGITPPITIHTGASRFLFTSRKPGWFERRRMQKTRFEDWIAPEMSGLVVHRGLESTPGTRFRSLSRRCPAS